MGPLGIQETVVIAVIALLIFGPKKLPELGRTIGKAMTEFRRASSELKASFDREMTTIERETASVKEVTQNYMSDTPSLDTYNHDNYYDSGAYGADTTDTPSQNPSTVGASATQGAEHTVPTSPASPGTGHSDAKTEPQAPAEEAKIIRS